jgi:Brp/Blh family beta-carotene 15,15'-monooxygenase
MQLALTVAMAFFPLGLQLQALLCGVMLCSVGVPHGANDHLYRSDKSITGSLHFIAIYLGAIFSFLALWWNLPVVAFILFFIISFHHFGQSNFENNSASYLPSWLWGIWILVFPVLLHWHEAIRIFEEMLSYNKHSTPIAFPEEGILFHVNGSFPIIIILACFYILSLFYFERENIRYYLIQFAVVTIWYLCTPLLSGFIVVFCLWHSLQSLRHQALYFTQTGGTLPAFFKALVPFSTVALLSFGVYLYFREFNIAEAFILLSLITLPHVVVMHRLYGETLKLPGIERG